MYHYHFNNDSNIREISYIQNNRKATRQIIFTLPLLLFLAIIGNTPTKNKNV